MNKLWSVIAVSGWLYGAPAAGACTGDCNGDGAVTVDEILRGVLIALGSAPLDACPNMDCCPEVCIPEIDCLQEAVNNALYGCPGAFCGGLTGRQCATSEVCDLHDPTCSTADLAGLCTPRPAICPEIFAPVCGCDAQTYSNDCERLRTGAALRHLGACQSGN